MSLYGALFSGVSGLQSQSSAMGAIADNVVNVNTHGYKRTDVQFQTLVTKQVSLTKYAAGGVQSKPRAAIDAQGLLQATTSATDIAISGQGFFIVNEAANPQAGDIFAYTRAGSFKVDKDGYLQNASGWYLQGWPLMTFDNNTQASQVQVGNNTYMKAYKNESGDSVYINDNIVDGTNLKPINLNTIGGTATATTTISMGLNLPSGDNPGQTHKTDVQFFDSLGNPHNLNHNWVKRASNAWDYFVVPPKGSTSFVVEDQTSLRNNYFSAGRLDFNTIPDLGTDMKITVDDTEYTIQFTSADDTDVLTQTITVDNLPADTETFTVTIDGTVTTFEFDSNNSVTAPNVAVTIGPDTASTAANLASAINTRLTASLGTATWVTTSGADITFYPTNNNRVSFADASGDVTVGSQSQTIVIATQPADAETIQLKVNNQIITFEFESAGGVAAGNTAVAIGADADATAANLAVAIDAALDAILGAGAHATNPGAPSPNINIAQQPGVASITGLFPPDPNTALTGSVTGAIVDTTIGINVQNRSLSQIMDQIQDRLQAIMHYEYGGIQAAPPNSWAQRLAGENSVYFLQGSTANSITMDARNATTNGVHATVQGSLTNSAGTNVAYTVEALDAIVAWTQTSNYAVEFNGDGTPDKFFGSDESTASDARVQYKVGWANGAADMDGSTTPALTVTLGNYNTTEGLTQFSGTYQINYIAQNGASFGNFAGISVGEDGVVTALFDNGVTKPVFMVPIATMVNPNGMDGKTGNVWIETDYSGTPTVREAGRGGAGSIASAALEASTVDIGEEFTAMITTQRAYSASTKIITTADEMLEELMRIK